MGLLDYIRNLIAPRPASNVQPVALGGRHTRARQSKIDSSDLPFLPPFMIEPPAEADSTWRGLSLDAKTLDKATPGEIIDLLVDISPEISRALFDFIRMFNPGYELVAFRPNSEVEHGPGQQALDEIWNTLRTLYGSPDVVLNRLIFAGFVRGAFFAELVLDDLGREVVDLATPDPLSARFKRLRDPLRGTIWQLGQYQGGQFVPLDAPTISYLPIDSKPNSPYGRPMIAPAIFSAIFSIALLHDLRRVVQQQGYPRLDISVQMERLLDIMPADLEGDPNKLQEWVEAVIDEIQSVYADLEPDDAYIHTDVVQVNRPVGTVDADSLGAVEGLIRALERMATRALKTMPLLMGSNETSSETHANRQWELHAAGIKSIQHLLEAQLENLLTVALQAQGIQARVEFRFGELRASEMLRDAQTEAMQIANAKAKYDYGWISQDEAAMEITGRPADSPAPRGGLSLPQPELIEGDGENEERWTTTSYTLSSTNGGAAIS